MKDTRAGPSSARGHCFKSDAMKVMCRTDIQTFKLVSTPGQMPLTGHQPKLHTSTQNSTFSPLLAPKITVPLNSNDTKNRWLKEKRRDVYHISHRSGPHNTGRTWRGGRGQCEVSESLVDRPARPDRLAVSQGAAGRATNLLLGQYFRPSLKGSWHQPTNTTPVSPGAQKAYVEKRRVQCWLHWLHDSQAL